MNTGMIWQTHTVSSAETERLGQAMGRLLNPPAVLELCSDLGGGKTTFVRGLVKGLGSADRVSSPTFTLNKIYKAKNFKIHHFDFYRLPEPGVVSDQLKESLQSSRVITVVEWSDIVRNVLPNDRITINFSPSPNSSDERLIEFTLPSSKLKIIEKLRTELAEPEP